MGHKAFTLIPNDSLTDEGRVKAKIATAGKCIYSAGFLARPEGFETSGNIRLNASPLAVSGSSCGESFGWVSSSFLAEDSESGGFTSSGIIASPFLSTSDSPIEPLRVAKPTVTTRIEARNRAFTWFWYDAPQCH